MSFGHTKSPSFSRNTMESGYTTLFCGGNETKLEVGSRRLDKTKFNPVFQKTGYTLPVCVVFVTLLNAKYPQIRQRGREVGFLKQECGVVRHCYARYCLISPMYSYVILYLILSPECLEFRSFWRQNLIIHQPLLIHQHKSTYHITSPDEWPNDFLW